MTITLAPVATPPGALPSSPIREVGNSFTAQAENALSQAIPIDRNAVAGDLLVVWLLTGAGGGNNSARDFGFWPRPLNYVTRKWSTGTGGGIGVYLDLFYTIIREGEAGGQLGITWDYGGGDAAFEMVARLYHGHDTESPIGSWGNGTENLTDQVYAHSGWVWVPQPGCLVDAAVAFNANSNVGTSPEGDTATHNQVTVGGFMPGIALLTGLLDFAYPYTWGGNTVGFSQGSSTNVPGAACGMGVCINPMPKPGPIAFGLSNRPGDSGTYMDTDGLAAAWTYRPRAGQGPQVGWIVAREHPDGSHQGFWNAGLNVWEPQQFANYSDLDSLVWPDGAWVNDGTQWRVQASIIEGEQYLPSDLSAPVTFTARARPVVTVTAPYGNVGAVPTAAWTVANGPGSAYRVRFFNSAQYDADGFDPDTTSPAVESGWITSGATTWTPPGLLGGCYYRAYVQVQRDNQLSDWAFGSFFANYNTLALPDVTTVASLDPVTGCPRAAVTVTGHDVAGYTGTTYVNVFRYDPKTQTMVPLRFGQNVPLPWPTQSITIYDYDMPPNRPVTYQAQVYSTKAGIPLTLDDPVYGLLDTASNLLG